MSKELVSAKQRVAQRHSNCRTRNCDLCCRPAAEPARIQGEALAAAPAQSGRLREQVQAGDEARSSRAGSGNWRRQCAGSLIMLIGMNVFALSRILLSSFRS